MMNLIISCRLALDLFLIVSLSNSIFGCFVSFGAKHIPHILWSTEWKKSTQDEPIYAISQKHVIFL